jgi:hypothetical protein
MEVLIGVDEAGYGPNYGPLVVAATAWSVEHSPAANAERAAAVDLYKLLRKAVCRAPDKAGRKLAIADSKRLYSPQLGLRQLERGVLAALAAMNGATADRDGAAAGDCRCIAGVAELLAATGADPHAQRHELACHCDDEMPLPLDALPGEVARLASSLAAACRQCGVVLVAVRARLVYPAEFNDLVERWGTKGAALSHVTMALVREVVDGLTGPSRGGEMPAPGARRPDARRGIQIWCDKHGGRSRYGALLQHHFPESWIEPVSESRHCSRYRWTHGGTPVEAEFRVRCEEQLPTALASMTAKYHRELAMRAFNAYWARHVPELRPTAGYPGDAARFRAEIAAVQSELAIADAMLWRNR